MPPDLSGAEPLLVLRRGAALPSWIAIGIAGAGVAAGCWTGFSVYRASGDATMLLVAPFIAAVPLMFGMVGLMGLRVRLRIFEDGIEGRGVFTPPRFVAFDEATMLTWVPYRRKVQHADVGNFIAGRLASPTAAAAFNVAAGHHGQRLADVCDRASGRIASRARQDLQRGGSFAWGRATLTAEGIAHNGAVLPSGLQFNDEIASGIYRLRRTDTNEQVIQMAARTPNFYPGLMLFRSLAGMSSR